MGRIVAPQHLTAPSKAIYRRVMEDFQLAKEPHAVRILVLALEASDRAEQARTAIAREGLLVNDRFGQARPHPAIMIERDARLAVARLFRELSLDAGEYASAPDARLPRIGSGAAS
jgi:phage terminase small subunit